MEPGDGRTRGPDGSAAGCKVQYVPYVGPACLRPDGHFEVFLADGTTLVTHGPDPLPPPGDIGFSTDAEQRQPVCAKEWHMRVLYGHPDGAPDRSAEVADQLRDAIRRMNALLNADALATGGVEADYKVLCQSDGDIRIDVFSGPDTGGSTYTADFDQIVNAAKRAGHTDARSDYLIFYDDSSDGVCGVGNLATDDRLSDKNANLFGPDYGVTYKSCWFGRTPMHENAHNQGAVQTLAPDSDFAGHCLEGKDVMCYPTSSILVLCGDRTYFDCDHDTYFNAALKPGGWLGSHWNIGSRLNSYIAFGDMPPPESGLPSQQPPASEGNATDGATDPDGNATDDGGSGNSTDSGADEQGAGDGSTGTSNSTAGEVVVADPAPAETLPQRRDPSNDVPGPALLLVLGALVLLAWTRRR